MLGRVFLRRLSSLAEPLPKAGQGAYPVPNTPGYKKLMEKQKLFCRDDGLLVWQKTSLGVTVYRAVIVLAIAGTLFNVVALVKFTSPPKN